MLRMTQHPVLWSKDIDIYIILAGDPMSIPGRQVAGPEYEQNIQSLDFRLQTTAAAAAAACSHPPEQKTLAGFL